MDMTSYRFQVSLALVYVCLCAHGSHLQSADGQLNHEKYTSPVPAAFVINRDTRPDRLRLFTRDIPPGVILHRVPAVELSAEEAKALILPGSNLTRGEVGCFRSHIGIWRRMVEERIPEALVFEDDANLSNVDLVKDLESCRKQLPPDWNVVFLGLNHHRVKAPINECFARQEPGSYGAHAYLINLRGAGKVLRAVTNSGISQPVDIFLSSDACDCVYFMMRANKIKQRNYSDTDTQRLR